VVLGAHVKAERLPAALMLAALSPAAWASYNDGDLGRFLVMVSMPIAGVAFVVTLVLVALGQFKKGAVLVAYAVVLGICAGGVVLFTVGDDKSVQFALLGEFALLVAVLLPAVIQYIWWQRKRRT
jgi:uncharacterized membrane protein